MSNFGKRGTETATASGGFIEFLKVSLATSITLYIAVLVFSLLIVAQAWQMISSIDPLQTSSGFGKKVGVNSGDDPAILRSLSGHLDSIAAPSSDAWDTEFVHLVFVKFSGTGPQSSTGDSKSILTKLGSEVRRATLDLSSIGKGAVVLVSNRQVIWKAEGAHIDDFAKIAFEGKYAFDLENAHPGLLAAFRIGAFGQRSVTQPRNFTGIHGARENSKNYCDAVKRWREYFDVDAHRIKTWLIENPGRLRVTSSGISDHGAGSIRSRRPANHCKMR